MKVKARTSAAGVAAALVIVMFGGWFVGANAASTGYVTWDYFRSNDVPLCAQHRADVNFDGTGGRWSAWERATDRSGSSTCGAAHGRPAGYIRIHLWAINTGAGTYYDYADNVSGASNAYYGLIGPSSTCFSTQASGRERDSDIGYAFNNPGYNLDSGTICRI